MEDYTVWGIREMIEELERRDRIVPLPEKIYWNEKAGAVFWLYDGAVMVAPMNRDNTSNLIEGGEVEVWHDCDETEAQIREKLA